MESETNQTQAPAKNMGMLYATIAIVILLAAGAGYFLLSNDSTSDQLNGEESATGPVAIVNGEEITREAYNNTVAQVNASLGQEAGTALDPQIQTQVIDSLVNNALIRQEVVASGVTPTEEEVQTEYDAIVANAGGAEALNTQLESLDMTDADLRADIAEQLAINNYLQTEANLEAITATDEEISTYYDQLATSNEELPPLEEVSEQIRQQIIAEKQQTAVAELLTTLRADADIQILI